MSVDIVETNRTFVKQEVNKKVNEKIDMLFNEIKRKNSIIKNKDKDLRELKDRFSQLARAYCKKVGIFISKKSNKQVYKETIKLLQKEVS